MYYYEEKVEETDMAYVLSISNSVQILGNWRIAKNYEVDKTEINFF